jgi:3-oxoacyl-[acyl-carrier protein] reductase
MLLNNSIFLITGTSRGIGYYLAGYYLNKGHKVIGCGRSNSSSITHSGFTYFNCDITSESDVINMFREIKRKFQRIDVVINNAGINTSLALSIMTSLKSAQDTFNTNVIATFLIARESAKLMVPNNYGRIINFGSMAAKHEVKGEAIYAASKAAINSMTRVMAKELYPFGITCNVIAPAAVETSLMAAVNRMQLEEVLKRNAVPTIGSMNEISLATDFIINKDNNLFTGQILYLGGA